MELPVPEYTIVVYSVMVAIIDALELADIPLLKSYVANRMPAPAQAPG